MNEEARATVDEISKQLEEALKPYVGGLYPPPYNLIIAVNEVIDNLIDKPVTYSINDVGGYVLEDITNDGNSGGIPQFTIHFRPPEFINAKFECTDSGCKVID